MRDSQGNECNQSVLEIPSSHRVCYNTTQWMLFLKYLWMARADCLLYSDQSIMRPDCEISLEISLARDLGSFMFVCVSTH